MRNLFFITSPLQLINAIEAREHFKTRNNLLVVIFTEYDSKNRHQINNLVNEQEWDEVIRFDLRGKDSKTTFFKQIRLVKLLQKQHYDYVFCGNLSSIGKMIIASIQKNTVYLLDDGAVTINHYLNSSGKHKSNKKLSLTKKIRQWRFNLFGLKTLPTDTLNLFTSYRFTPHGNEKIIPNDLKYFKQTFLSHTIPDETVYFLGQPLADIKLVSNETYLEYIRKIIDFYQCKIIYIPHRAEIVHENLLQLKNENFIVHEIHQPIELEFIASNQYPLRICSFFSSALFTLNILYPKSEIISFVIESDDMVQPRPEIQNVYHYAAANTTIKTIDLRNL